MFRKGEEVIPALVKYTLPLADSKAMEPKMDYPREAKRQQDLAEVWLQERNRRNVEPRGSGNNQPGVTQTVAGGRLHSTPIRSSELGQGARYSGRESEAMVSPHQDSPAAPEGQAFAATSISGDVLNPESPSSPSRRDSETEGTR